MSDENHNASRPALIVDSGPYRCAFPLDCVVETMRPLPIRSFANVPAFVRGAATVRGEPVPVVDLARLLGAAEATVGRFVVVRADRRKVVLAVQSVVGVKDLDQARVASVPPLLQAAHREFVSALGTADEGLLVVLSNAWALPEEAWAAFEKDQG